MGITWRFIMPLLSTLAALVIIVHSAEENLEQDYGYDLRPKAMDRGPTGYGQEWRMAEPIMQQPAAINTWNDDIQELSPVRRRLGRKRKRRPPADVIDEVLPQNEHTNIDEESPVHQQYDSPPEDAAEMPRRRRKKARPNRWTDEPFDENVPIRRRLQRRRKRPSLDNRPTLSEFGEYSRDTANNKDQVIVTDYNEEERIDNDDLKYKKYDEEERVNIENMKYKKYEVDDEYTEREIKVPKSKPKFTRIEDHDKPGILFKEDKSLSEFSTEVLNSDEQKVESQSANLQDKIREKSPSLFYKDKDNVQNQEPISPQTLKDILKRSNGTSLSEILQQHNFTLADLLSGNENAIAILRSQNLLQSAKNVTDSTTDVSESDTQIKLKSSYKSMIPASRKIMKPTEKPFNSELPENKNQDSFEGTTKVDTLLPENLDTKTINRVKTPNRRKITKPRLKTNGKQLNDENFENKNDSSFVTTISQKDPLPVETENIDINEENVSNRNVNNVTKSNNSNLQNELQNGSTSTDSAITMATAKRRFTGGIRRKLRMRPMLSSNYKSQLNRDLMALSARRYIHHNRRNVTKAKQWREMLPFMPNLNVTTDSNINDITLAPTFAPEETTTLDDMEDLELSTIADTTYNESDIQDQTVTTNTEEVETTTLMIEILESEIPSSITEKPLVNPVIRTDSASELRRHAYNNRLKKKRLKHKTSTTEAPPDDVMKNFLNMGDYVSSSEFIARTQVPKWTSPINMRETATELEDFMTTETTSQINIESTSNNQNLYKSLSQSTTLSDYPITVTTEETAKIEIEEILNDTSSSARLSRILKERNMTLGELVEHRERGSSHVHLADIFHNTSREPRPTEPFLTKSSLEPISKETYPLRALLDANIHDTTVKIPTTDPNMSLMNHITIPMTKAYGNNVNENAENMGIMSLFNNFTIDSEHIEESTIQKDSDGTLYRTTIFHVNATDDDDNTRESRIMGDDQDMVSWNEIFAMIRQHNNESSELEKSDEGAQLLTTQKAVETNEDGAKLIGLEHLHHLSETSSIKDGNVQSESMEKIEFNSYESGEYPNDQRIPNNLPSSAKSVTVATASLVGLAMVLFLLTYTVLKWRQQRSLNRKNNFHNERIPTPVFENRKIKKNCSSRSISPMLPTSSIYTMNTLEAQNGKESPEYMWDTLRKPFQ